LNIISSASEGLVSQYNLLLYLGSALSVLVFLSCLFHIKKTLFQSLFYTVLCFGAFYYWAYNRADEFYQLTLEGDTLVASYIAPRVERVIPLKNVVSVTFGTKTQSTYTCFIALHTLTGEKFRSIDIEHKTQHCKGLRSQLLKLKESS